MVLGMPLQRCITADGRVDAAEFIGKIPSGVQRANRSRRLSRDAARIAVGTQPVSLLYLRQNLFEKVMPELIGYGVVLNTTHPIAGSRGNHHVDHRRDQ